MLEGRVHAPEDDAEYEALFVAANDGSLEQLQAAWKPSLDINALESDVLQGRSALHIAAQAGNITAIHFLLSHGAKVDLPNAETETPLHEAAFWARSDAVKVLLDAGADLHRRTGDYTMTALHNVMKYKNTVTNEMCDTIAVLLDYGADVNAKADEWGSTLLGQACSLHSLELVEMLVGRGAVVDGALPAAVDDTRIVKFLLNHGAKIGNTSALADAAGTGNTEVVRLLLAHADEADIAGSAEALHYAAARGSEEISRLLIERGFNVNDIQTSCPYGETPLLATCTIKKFSPERMAVVGLLVENGADPHYRGRNGQSAAERLMQSDFRGAIQDDEVLLQKMAKPPEAGS